MSNSPIYTIYKATNTINGKCYVGFDSKWPNRQKSHKNSYKYYNYPFYNAIKKYGFEAFKWEVLYQSRDKDHTLKEAETYFIKEYNTINENYGYNITEGGQGRLGCKTSEETRKKQSEIKLKNGVLPNSGQFKKGGDVKIGKKTQFKNGQIPHNKGKKHSEEIREKMRLAWIKKKEKYASGELIHPTKGKKLNTKHNKQFKKGIVPWNKGLKGIKKKSDINSNKSSILL